jgi:hypothetical protein
MQRYLMSDQKLNINNDIANTNSLFTLSQGTTTGSTEYFCIKYTVCTRILNSITNNDLICSNISLCFCSNESIFSPNITVCCSNYNHISNFGTSTLSIDGSTNTFSNICNEHSVATPSNRTTNSGNIAEK